MMFRGRLCGTWRMTRRPGCRLFWIGLRVTVATLDDVQGSLMRYLEDDEKTWVQALLDRAEALILSRMPDAVNRCRVDYSFSIIMRMVEAESVSRVLRAPGGGLYKYETEGTYTYSVNQAVASGILEITDRDWRALQAGTSGWGVAGAEMDGYARRTHLLGALEGPLTVDPTYLRGPSALDFAGDHPVYDEDEVTLW
nr:MAG TPA: hypothetical protein [Caudoviricetes sp.]